MGAHCWEVAAHEEHNIRAESEGAEVVNDSALSVAGATNRDHVSVLSNPFFGFVGKDTQQLEETIAEQTSELVVEFANDDTLDVTTFRSEVLGLLDDFVEFVARDFDVGGNKETSFGVSDALVNIYSTAVEVDVGGVQIHKVGLGNSDGDVQDDGENGTMDTTVLFTQELIVEQEALTGLEVSRSTLKDVGERCIQKSADTEPEDETSGEVGEAIEDSDESVEHNSKDGEDGVDDEIWNEGSQGRVEGIETRSELEAEIDVVGIPVLFCDWDVDTTEVQVLSDTVEEDTNVQTKNGEEDCGDELVLVPSTSGVKTDVIKNDGGGDLLLVSKVSSHKEEFTLRSEGVMVIVEKNV